MSSIRFDHIGSFTFTCCYIHANRPKTIFCASIHGGILVNLLNIQTKIRQRFIAKPFCVLGWMARWQNFYHLVIQPSVYWTRTFDMGNFRFEQLLHEAFVISNHFSNQKKNGADWLLISSERCRYIYYKYLRHHAAYKRSFLGKM